MRKSKFKRCLAMLLSCVLSFSCIPFNLESVFANLQTHVRDVVMRVLPQSGNATNINFTWTNPSWSTLTDGDASDGDAIHSPEGFRVMERNITAGEGNFKNASGDLAGNDLTTATISRDLTTGSLYMYKVIPFHKHRYPQPDGTYITKEAPNDTSSAENLLFMSDLKVEAQGSGSNLTVTWDNPLYNNKSIFSGYRIYYQRGGSNVTNFNNYKDVSIDNEELITLQDSQRDGVSRLRYSVYDASLAQGEVYAVKVEPLYNGSEIRKLTSLSYANISIGNTVYKISFNSYNTNEYRTNDAYISIPLEILENGKDYLNLHWWGLSNTIGNIERVEVYKGAAKDDIGMKLGTIYSSQAIYVNYWQIDKPTEVTYYQLRIYIEGMNEPLTSEIAVYDPNVVNITPNKPKLFVEVNQTASTNTLDLFWSVFQRYPYTDSEKEFADKETGLYIDTNVKYDLWVTDNLADLEDPNLPKTLEGVTPSQLTQTTIEQSKTPVYSTSITTYTGRNSEGEFATMNLVQNKVYYFKLLVSKPVELGDDLVGEPAYATQYFPADGDIATPQSLNKPPLKIKEDADGNELVTSSSIALEWRTKWYEIYDSVTDSWYSSASVKDSTIYYGDEEGTSGSAISFAGSTSKERVQSLFSDAGLSEDQIALLPIRQVDISGNDIKYEMLYIPYADINDVDGGYEAYLKNIMTNENANWQTINPTMDSDVTASYNITGLDENTTYAFIIRPYRILPDGQKDAYPAYILGTTLPKDPNVEITPTVPVLEEDSHDDMSITVKWQEHLNSLDYELAYSTNLLDDPSTGSMISMEEISTNGETTVENEIRTRFYKIKGLMPETGYYIWLRASANNEGGRNYSSWSSPIYVITSELGKPDVPTGLGLVAQDTINIFNSASGTDYKRRTDEYIGVEWNRNDDDIGPSPATATSGDRYEVLAADGIQNTIAVKINQLIANSNYFARVKARCTVSIGSDGTREKTFTYILQFADNRDFKDALTIVVPDGEAEIVESKYVKESDWSDTVRFKSGTSDDEYDSDVIDSHYPLPDDDFEYIYDGFTNTLTYRFRSNLEDQDGLDDNFVDQRFISSLLTKQVYEFEVDLTYYNNYQIKNRVVEIPYSIVKAFDEHDIVLYVKADNVKFGFTPEFLNTQQVNSLAGYGRGASVRIKVSASPDDAPIVGFGQTYISPAQKLSVDIVTPNGTTAIKQFYKDISVGIKLNDKYTMEETNVDAYYDTDLTTEWQRLANTYDSVSGTFISKTKIPATFSAIRKNAPSISTNDSNAINALVSLNSRIAITDMQYAKPNAVVSTVQFNNIVAAIANGRKDVAINGALPDADYTALSRRGLLITAPTVSREEGINVLVKLYEVKTGRQAPYTSIQVSQYKDIANANPSYQTALLKAGDLGFYGNTYGARPKDTMSLTDLLYMADIIIRDCGL